MTTRLIVAYGLIALMALFAVCMALWARHNTFARRDLRQRQRDDEMRDRQAEARQGDG
jgi:hypothetical protein